VYTVLSEGFQQFRAQGGLAREEDERGSVHPHSGQMCQPGVPARVT